MTGASVVPVALAVALAEPLAETARVTPDAVVTTRVVPAVECGALMAVTAVARLLSAET